MPSFAFKRRSGIGTSGSSSDTKDRSGSGIRNELSTGESGYIRRAGASSSTPNATSNSSSGPAFEGRDRRIGSGRIPMRDVTWNEYHTTTKPEKDSTPSATSKSSTEPTTTSKNSN